MTDDFRKPTGGSNPRAPKRKHGRGWIIKRARGDRSWRERKLKSRRYCVSTSVRG